MPCRFSFDAEKRGRSKVGPTVAVRATYGRVTTKGSTKRAWMAVALLAVACGSGSAGEGTEPGAGGTSGVVGSGGASTAGSSDVGSGGSFATGPGSGGSVSSGGEGGGGTSGAGASGVGGAAGGRADGGGMAGAGGSTQDAGAPDSGANALDPEIATAVASVSTMRIGGAIDMLAGFPTRNACATPAMAQTGIVAAHDWVRGQFQAIPG